MNRIVFCPEVRRRLVAAAIARRISATLLSTPLRRINFECVISAMTWARVVLPVPGGPEKITEGKRSASMARRRSLPGARICSWPTNSSSERGRIRVASGAALVALAGSTSSSSLKRSCTRENTAGHHFCILNFGLCAKTQHAPGATCPQVRGFNRAAKSRRRSTAENFPGALLLLIGWLGRLGGIRRFRCFRWIRRIGCF